MRDPGDAFRDLVEVMARLRAPDGCPWDREQTHESLARHLLEETYETLDAIDRGDLENLREELGDLVLQVVFHAEIAEEEGAFTVSDVVDDLRAKLIRRHPHVFGETEVSGASEVLANWEKLKRAEKGTRVMEGIPKALPALARAAKVWNRGRQVGFRRDEALEGTLAKLDEEIAELRHELQADPPDVDRISSEIGDVLFIISALAHRFGLEAETSLRQMLERAEDRFSVVESRAAADGRDLESLSADEWQGYWEQAKQELTRGDAQHASPSEKEQA